MSDISLKGRSHATQGGSHRSRRRGRRIGIGPGSGPGGFVDTNKELGPAGCAGGWGGALRLCFGCLTAVAPSLSRTIDVAGRSSATSDFAPHMKVRFGKDTEVKVGSLLSRDISAVPEPDAHALMLAGLAMVGFVARRRQNVCAGRSRRREYLARGGAINAPSRRTPHE